MDSILNSKIKSTRKGYNQTLNTRAYSTKTTGNEIKKELTSYQIYKGQRRLSKISEVNPLAQDFITHYVKTYEDTADDNFSVLDLETVELIKHNSIQMPVCITHKTTNDSNARRWHYQVNTSNLDSDNLELIYNDVNEMFKDFMIKITLRSEGRYNNRFIFVHNLGGLFIYKNLVQLYGDKISCLINDGIKYISIS